jgi:hypothetical protein
MNQMERYYLLEWGVAAMRCEKKEWVSLLCCVGSVVLLLCLLPWPAAGVSCAGWLLTGWEGLVNWLVGAAAVGWGLIHRPAAACCGGGAGLWWSLPK